MITPITFLYFLGCDFSCHDIQVLTEDDYYHDFKEGYYCISAGDICDDIEDDCDDNSDEYGCNLF